MSGIFAVEPTAQGFFKCLERAIEYVQVQDWKTKLIGFGCNGASANMADGGLKGLIKGEVPWIFMFWCLAHRLELSVKDALKSTFFATIDEILLRIIILKVAKETVNW